LIRESSALEEHCLRGDRVFQAHKGRTIKEKRRVEKKNVLAVPRNYREERNTTRKNREQPKRENLEKDLK